MEKEMHLYSKIEKKMIVFLFFEKKSFVSTIKTKPKYNNKKLEEENQFH